MGGLNGGQGHLRKIILHWTYCILRDSIMCFQDPHSGIEWTVEGNIHNGLKRGRTGLPNKTQKAMFWSLG